MKKTENNNTTVGCNVHDLLDLIETDTDDFITIEYHECTPNQIENVRFDTYTCIDAPDLLDFDF